MSTFTLSCESTVDLPFSYVNSRDIPVLFYEYSIDGQPYPDDMLRDPAALPRFYQFLDDGKMPSTSQLNEFDYESFFEAQLQKGDLLHIAFGSGMTQSVQNAVQAAQTLRQRYPNRRLEVIDSLCSSSGYGLLVDYAADLRDAGRLMDEVIDWVMAHRQRIHHQFYATRLDFYRRIRTEYAAHLNQRGALLLEVGFGQAAAVCALFGENAYVLRDLCGVERVVAVC